MKCENCGNDHDGSYGSGRFCDSKCARGFSTKKNRDEISKKVSISLGGNGEIKPKENYCLNCGKKLKSSRGKYCNNTCHADFNKKKFYEDTIKLGGFDYGPNHQGQKAKRFIIDTRGHKCEICKNTEWMGKPIPLVLDHIDGKSSNWTLTNLRVVCGNCDMQLPTYKFKNHGNCTRQFNVKLKSS